MTVGSFKAVKSWDSEYLQGNYAVDWDFPNWGP